jgi:hypothetical protein
LPDGIFPQQNTQYGYILEGLGIENVGIFVTIHGHWVILWMDIGKFCSHLVYISRFWYIVPKQSGNPAAKGLVSSATVGGKKFASLRFNWKSRKSFLQLFFRINKFSEAAKNF